MNFCCMDSQDMRVLLEGEVENTGVYSLETAECLTSRGYFVWLENPLQIKLSSGMRRGKKKSVQNYLPK